MCSPQLSFLINRAKNIFHKDGMQSHANLIKHFALDESKVVKVSYDWITRTLDILGENTDDNENQHLAFELKQGHYAAIDSFVRRTVGTDKLLKIWLKKNFTDSKIKTESRKLFTWTPKKISWGWVSENWMSIRGGQSEGCMA